MHFHHLRFRSDQSAISQLRFRFHSAGMAFYNCSYPGYDLSGEHNLSYNHISYDSAPAQSFMGYSSYDYDYQPSLCTYPKLAYASSYNEPSSSYYSNIAYSANIVSESNLIEYYPAQTQLVISYSTLEFNEPDFEEYDPTPYDGGYDIIGTYGKPLPPSDETCYPRSTPDTHAYGSIPEARVEDESIKLEPIKMEVADEEKQLVEVTENDHEAQNEKTDDSSDKSREDSKQSENVDGYSGYPYYENEKIVPIPYPSGYGLETLDLCESLFGYWPCLARMKKRMGNGYECSYDNLDVQEYKDDMCRGTADYIFGSPNPYGGMETEDGRSYGGDTLYAYHAHYPAQSLYMQALYDDAFKFSTN